MEKQQVDAMMNSLYEPVFDMIFGFIGNVFAFALGAVAIFAVLFFLGSRINPFRMTPAYLANKKYKFLPYELLRWLLYDYVTRGRNAGVFQPFGFTIFCGPQGAGKTTSMIKYLWDMKQKYPECLIVTNFACEFADHRMVDWHDLLTLENGTKGIIFAIDEIHAEYSAATWKDFPETLLSQISMQRKQKIKIVATAQVYSRVAKPIREQTFSVVLCYTYFGRLTTNKEYAAEKFVTTGDGSYSIRKGVRPIWRNIFVQSNEFREKFDTYEVIERMKKIEFIPRNERGE